MGFRFRRSVKLAPGLRMNFSGSGVSLTAGPRGASVSFGSRGTYFNAGIPGTGLYARERIGGGEAVSRTASSSRETVGINATVSIEDDGTITFKDSSGTPLPDFWIAKAKRQHGDAIRKLIVDTCDKLNAPAQALATIHLHTPAPDARIRFTSTRFDRPMPSPPIPKKPGLWGWLFKRHAQRVEEANRQATAKYERDLAEWKCARAAFESAEADRKDFLERRILTELAAMEQHVEQALADISWPRETQASFEVLEEGKLAAVDVDLPEIEDMPKRTFSVPARGYKLSVKDLSAAQIQKVYTAHVHGIGFRIIGEIFALLPSVSTVILSAYSQRAVKTTGVVSDEYLYSVRVKRDAWSVINFKGLEGIDVADALNRFELRRSMTRSGAFNPIEPLAPGEVASLGRPA